MFARCGLVIAGLLAGAGAALAVEPASSNSPTARQEAAALDHLPPVPPAPPGHIDRSGRKQAGHASYYANRFANRKMANGRPMNPESNIAASKTLPLGSVAKVTNLDNGKSATVKIEDRGPYVDGRVVDLAPKVARDLDMQKAGVVPVEVKPISIPKPDGEVALGAGAAEVSPGKVDEAVQTTKELTGKADPPTPERTADR